MAQIDKFIGMMVQSKYDRAVLVNDKPGSLYTGSALTPGPIIPSQQLQNVVMEITPENLRSTLTQGSPVQFPYQSSHGPYTIAVERTSGGLQLTIAPAGHTAAEPPAPSHAGEKATEGNPEAGEGHAPSAADNGAPHAGGATTRVIGTRIIQHLDEMFHTMGEIDASDLHLGSDEQPFMRVHGILKAREEYGVHNHDVLKKLVYEIAPERNRNEFDGCGDTDFAYELEGVARFRCSLFMERHGIGGLFRLIPSKVLTAQQLNLSKAILDLCYLSKGLVVVTGPTGSGKSTTLAAMIDYINKNRDEHIITIEDPIEFVHNNINCLLHQREVHVHTESFKRALRAALRQDPDIVLVGEMRDLETIAIAIETAETGHLVFGTLHTSTAASTVDRIIDQFPADQQAQIRVMLSESLKGIIAQSLLRTVDGKRVAAFEILLVPNSVSNLIREGKTFQLPSMMQIGKAMGMVTMNDSIVEFVKKGVVAPMEGYVKAMDKAGLLEAYKANDVDFELGGNEPKV